MARQREKYTVKNVRDQQLSIVDIKNYTLSLQSGVIHWYYLHNPEMAPYSEDIKIWLDKLYRLNHGAFAPLLMAIFSKNEDYNDEQVGKLLELMERYIFLIFRVSQRRSNTGDSEFFTAAKNYYLSDKPAEVLNDIIGIGDLDIDKCGGIHWWLEKYTDLKQFKLYLDDKFKYREGYYSWNGLNYFLFEYELYLREKNKAEEIKIDWQAYASSKGDHITIEHVLPQKADAKCWKDAFSKLSEDELKRATHTLGNLTPLARAKNSKFQNYCFDVKKGGEEGFVGFKNGSYAEQEINEKKQWTISEVNERGLKLLEFMADRWNIDELQNNPTLQQELLFTSMNEEKN